jgi:hypothetical protein
MVGEWSEYLRDINPQAEVKFLSRGTPEISPMAVDETNPSGRSLHFTCNASEQRK